MPFKTRGAEDAAAGKNRFKKSRNREILPTRLRGTGKKTAGLSNYTQPIPWNPKFCSARGESDNHACKDTFYRRTCCASRSTVSSQPDSPHIPMPTEYGRVPSAKRKKLSSSDCEDAHQPLVSCKLPDSQAAPARTYSSAQRYTVDEVSSPTPPGVDAVADLETRAELPGATTEQTESKNKLPNQQSRLKPKPTNEHVGGERCPSEGTVEAPSLGILSRVGAAIANELARMRRACLPLAASAAAAGIVAWAAARALQKQGR
ncbi:membrane protein US8A [Gallid alphaherpesvirus 1]|uniref:US9 protein n=1 Tax=Infectious laryngotracheitis virus TaxID=10386 RepID=H8ZR44_ILTV|nr:US9 protein [Gallid alphaherpesvirus 1]ATG31458.1 membrane protein US8A [Gallid alphaherpesvirus 1]AUT12007.1 membrane protein US8A [Gallid alphaherpesvirus 1]UPW36911.1 membrane protein US8A [Gallid alphaherpesvirus 1]UPW36989.1 membrane protein US8A [Gallid alphaherpesvirus 1]